ncbi:hypothetical protein L218DRAFT_224995 [Marasmius fiardii PR-910]|nr:hypothetical protein L218DRAFT_224995 [Marasmius fiardii PR-910]
MNSSSEIEHIVAPYFTVTTVVTQPLSILSVMLFIYGIYVVLFGLSVHTLCRRDGPSSKLYMGWTISLFVLATIYTATYIWGISRQAALDFSTATTKDYETFFKYLLIGVDKKKSAWIWTCVFTSSIMNAIADSMLIHRCYTIWQSKFILYVLAFVAVVLNGITFGCATTGIIGERTTNLRLYESASAIDNATAIATAVFQVLLALLTGGRIWWISRQARRLMGRSTNAKYNSITAIIIESGVLYASCLIGLFIFEFTADPDSTGIAPFDFAVVSTLMSGLAPTLIIVRVSYGKSVNSVQQMVSTLHFADVPENSQKSRPVANVVQLRTHIDDHRHSSSETSDSEPSSSGPTASEKMV